MTVTETPLTEARRDDRPAVTVHDFRRPEGLTRSQRESVDAALTRFGTLAGEELTDLLRGPVTVDTDEVDESTWGDLLASRDDHPHPVPFSLDPLAGTAVLVLPTATARTIADLRLGGTGADDSDGPLDTVEHELVGQVALHVLHRLQPAFADLVAVTPRLVGPEAGDLASGALGADDVCLVARYVLTLDGRPPCRFDLCLAPPTLRGLAEALRSRRAQMEAGRSRSPTRQTAERLAHVPLEVTLQFPTIVTTAESVLQLAVGDELTLGIPTSDPLEVRAEGVLVARATIGRAGDRKACSIVEEVLP